MTSYSELTLPIARADRILTLIGAVIVVGFGLLAILNIVSGDAILASGLWLVLVSFWIISACQDAGGMKRYLFDRLGVIAGRLFVSRDETTMPSDEIYFGYSFLGRRLIVKSIRAKQIRYVEWNPGQATSMVGRDMNDWSISLWYTHNDPSRLKKRGWSRRPDQDVYIVGPSGARKDTEALAIEFVSFLRDAGLPMVQIDDKSFRSGP